MLVFYYGLIGVAIGTLVAVGYRTCYLVWYLSHHILCRELSHFKKHLFVDILTVTGMILATYSFKMTEVSYGAWCVLACKTGMVCLIISAVINWLFYRQEIIQLYQRIRSKLPFWSHN